MPGKIEIDLARVENLLAEGKSVQAVADALGVNQQTLSNRFHADPDAKAVLERGRNRAKLHKILSAGNDKARVLKAIMDGFNSRGKLTAATQLVGPPLERALYDLQNEDLVLDGEENAVGVELFKVRAKFLPLDATPVPPPVAAAASAPLHVPEVVSDERLAPSLAKKDDATKTVSPRPAKKRAVRKASRKRSTSKALVRTGSSARTTTVARRQPTAPAAITQVENSTPPPAPSVPGEITRALGAAQVELLYQRFWGEPSPQAERVDALIHLGLTAAGR
jgi:hypothetical protein